MRVEVVTHIARQNSDVVILCEFHQADSALLMLSKLEGIPDTRICSKCLLSSRFELAPAASKCCYIAQIDEEAEGADVKEDLKKLHRKIDPRGSFKSVHQKVGVQNEELKH